MKKFILFCSCFLISAASVFALTDAEREEAIEVCHQLGGTEYISVGAISGAEELICYFVEGEDCHENQLINGNCELNRDEVKFRKTCNALGGSSVISDDAYRCDFGELGYCSKGQILFGACEIDDAIEYSDTQCLLLGGIPVEERNEDTGEYFMTCYVGDYACTNDEVLAGECVAEQSVEERVQAENFVDECRDVLGGEVGTKLNISGESYQAVCKFGNLGSCSRNDVENGECTLPMSTFRDVSESPYRWAISYVEKEGIVEGYDDGSYRPGEEINRAEFAKIVIEALYESAEFDPFNNVDCFPDSLAGAWFNRYVCFAKSRGIINGHGDGNYYPSDSISYEEALKIILEAYDYELFADADEEWYQPYVNFAEEKGLSFNDEIAVGEKISRAQVAELIFWIDFL